MCLPSWREFRAKREVLQDVLVSDSQASELLHEEPSLKEEEWGKGNVHIQRLCTPIILPLHSSLQRNKAWIFIIPIYQGWNPGRGEGEFPQDKKGAFGGKAKITLKSVTGSQDPANTTNLVFPNRRVPPHNCFSNTTKGIELGVQGSRRRRVEKEKPAEFQIFGVHL